MTQKPDVHLDPYPGLPRGSFFADSLPLYAAAAVGNTDEGVWSAAWTLHQNAIDPNTGQPYNGRSADDVAQGTVRLAAATCQSLAMRVSTRSDQRAVEMEAEATEHLVEAVDHIEQANGVLNEPLTGPDGEITDGRRIQLTHHQDEELARQRSREGDSRHTQKEWAASYRTVAAFLLGLLDLLLLWKPMLNLSLEGNADNVFRWCVCAGLTGLQVVGIEWVARRYVSAERLSVDMRGAAGDYNRPFKNGGVGSGKPAPSKAQIADADADMAHAHRWLVLMASLIAIVGGVRVAVLARRAELPIYEAALFGVIIGLILGFVVIQMAHLYCRGNLLGDRLRAEREALSQVDRKLQHLRGVVATERQRAHEALDAAEILTTHAAQLRALTVTDYWRAVELAWTWFGLPYDDLQEADFKRRATPVIDGPQSNRAKLLERLDLVNHWLAERPTVFVSAPVAMIEAAAEAATAPATTLVRAPLRQPGDNRLHLVGETQVDLPVKPKPPLGWMVTGAAITLVATVVTAILAPGLDADQNNAASVTRYETS